MRRSNVLEHLRKFCTTAKISLKNVVIVILLILSTQRHYQGFLALKHI
ncbi:hypothetical protein NECAME_08768 [Necator americanus]|uniref:Uncharacterized protein n=1 Tax=Necator americanus TaxID=51031 RepID=W2TIS7_NECAM|nr:hypothetical protein NECAME_08768 [Necator americanus]ETN81066.1 hypothetical protein NECAME_08768 [Necator americanus]